MKRKNSLRKQCLERDNFTCKKCFIVDKTGRELEAHHVIPLVYDGKDNLDNLIILCRDCHHFAPNSKEDFDNYMKEECNGTMTTLIRVWKKLMNKLEKEKLKRLKKIKSPFDV